MAAKKYKELNEDLERELENEKLEAREHLQKLEQEMDELQRHDAATSAELHEARRANLEAHESANEAKGECFKICHCYVLFRSVPFCSSISKI